MRKLVILFLASFLVPQMASASGLAGFMKGFADGANRIQEEERRDTYATKVSLITQAEEAQDKYESYQLRLEEVNSEISRIEAEIALYEKEYEHAR